MTVQHTDPATAEDRRAAIWARLNAATEGPWVYENDTDIHGYRGEEVHYVTDVVAAADDDPPIGSFTSREDAELAASAPSDLSWLLSELEAAQARLDKVAEFIDQRREVITALRNAGTGAQENGDYPRWQGHAEARRVLAEALGIDLDKETGGLARALGLGEEAGDER